MENMSDPETDVAWHFGYWGQFINSRGTFNHRRGEELRRTGEFPFPPRFSWCKFVDLEEHLDSFLG
jgi:hypothetical protein